MTYHDTIIHPELKGEKSQKSRHWRSDRSVETLPGSYDHLLRSFLITLKAQNDSTAKVETYMTPDLTEAQFRKLLKRAPAMT